MGEIMCDMELSRAFQSSGFVISFGSPLNILHVHFFTCRFRGSLDPFWWSCLTVDSRYIWEIIRYKYKYKLWNTHLMYFRKHTSWCNSYHWSVIQNVYPDRAETIKGQNQRWVIVHVQNVMISSYLWKLGQCIHYRFMRVIFSVYLWRVTFNESVIMRIHVIKVNSRELLGVSIRKDCDHLILKRVGLVFLQNK